MAYMLRACLMVISVPSAMAFAASREGMQSQVGVHAQESMHTRTGVQEHTQMELASNPIRKVVNLLKKMLDSNRELSAQANKICEDKKCACAKKLAAQQKLIDSYSKNLPALELEYKELYAEIHGLKLDLKKDQAELDEKKEQYDEMVALHEKEYEENIKILKGYEQNIDALEKAIAALNRGLTGSSTGASFLQSNTANLLRKLVSSAPSSTLTDPDRDSLQAFLEQGTSEQDDTESPSTDEVIGILKQMKDTMQKDYNEMKKAYYVKTAEYQRTKEILEKQIAALQAAITKNTVRLGTALVRLAELDAEIRNILGGGYLREKALLDEMKAACDKEQAACDKSKKMYAEEATAISEAIALLNSDEALDLFKKTLPGSSFLQVGVTTKQLVKLAHTALDARRKGKRDYRIDVICLAMQGKKIDFTEVVDMIDELIGVLKKEEDDDYKKKADCEKSLGEAHFKKKFLDKKLEPIMASMGEVQDELDRIKGEIKEMTDFLEGLNKAADEMKAAREKENAQYVKELAADHGAMDLLKVAKARLTSFYGSYLQVNKPQNAAKVLELLDQIIHDHEMHMAANADAEKSAQEDYEKLLEDSKAAREERLEMLMTLRRNEDEAEDRMQSLKDENRELLAEKTLLARTIADLHKTCDWLVKNFDERLAARQSEILSLKNAKTVLLGGTVS